MPAVRGRFWSWAGTAGATLVALVLVEYLAVPQFVRATSDLSLVADATPMLLVLALVLEISSLVSYTVLTRAVLPASRRSRFVDQFRIDLTGLGFSHVVPGGGASAAALRFRLMTSNGLPASDAAATAAVQTALVAVGLLTTFVGGVVLAGSSIRSTPGYAAAGVASAAVLVGVLVAMTSTGHRSSGPPSPPRRPDSGRLVGRLLAATVATARSTVWRARVVVHDPRRRIVVLGCAAGNCLLDAASLWVCLRAYGLEVHPGALLMAYGAANLLGLLPVTPGGLGVTEGAMIPALVALGGVALAPVTLGVLTWRLWEFWLPIPVAAVAYVSLRWSRRANLVAGTTPRPSG